MTFSEKMAGIQREGNIRNLIGNLKDPNINTRWKAARSLADLGEDAVDTLIMNLYSDNPGTRLLSAWALGNVGSRRALPYLERMIDDEDPCARLAVECALQRITRNYLP